VTKDKSFVNNMDQHSWRPKLRENIWHMRSDAEPDDPAFLITSKAKYELPAQYVRGFLKIRPYCTGHNSLSTIAEMTQTNADDLLVFLIRFLKSTCSIQTVASLCLWIEMGLTNRLLISFRSGQGNCTRSILPMNWLENRGCPAEY